jgi:hypothetical protein
MVHHRSFEQVSKSEHLSRSRFREDVGVSAILAPGRPFDTGLVPGSGTIAQTAARVFGIKAAKR